MAAITPVASVEAFFGAIQKSGLLTSGAFDKVREAAGKATDPKELARDLVKDGTLTRWQADQLLHGFYKLTIGKYKLLNQLGTGEIGRVYLAEHGQMGRRHTLKVLAKRLASDAAAVKQFLDEAKHACGLDHRNICHVYDVNQEGDRPYVVMQHAEGEDLQRRVERGGRLPLAEALNYAMQIADGLAYAHENGVVHGDLKPANLLREPSGTIKIMDIGQARLTTAPGSTGEESIEMASLAMRIFRAPEANAGAAATTTSDIYSLGSVLCFLLSGKTAADTAMARKLLGGVAELPTEIVESCCRMMAEKPEERPASMRDVLVLLVEAGRPAPPPVSDDDVDAAPAGEEQGAKESRGKGSKSGKGKKKPPVAKSLDKSAEAESSDADTAQPFGPVVINPRRARGKPAATAAKSKNAQPEESDSGEKKTYTPLILAGSIGGGVVLLILIGLFVWLFAFGRGKQQLAQNTKAAPTAAASKKASPAEAEANPEAPAEEKNPEATVTPSVADLEALAAATSKESKQEPSSAPAAGSGASKPPEKPAEKAEPPATETTEAAKSEPKPAEKSEPKPETKPAPPPAKPAPAKTAPKPEPKAVPFQGFAAAVALPELPDMPGQPATTALEPKVLGPCKVDDKTTVAVKLLGGDAAIRSSRQKFDVHAKEGGNDWNILLAGEMPTTIATLAFKEGNAVFQWTDDAVKQPTIAKQLCNCALDLQTGTSRHVVALRTAVVGQPLAIDIEKPGTPAKWTIESMPNVKRTFIEVTKVEGFKPIKKEPKGAVNPGETITVWSGKSEKSPSLALKLSTTSTARSVTVNLQPQVKLEHQDLRPYRRKDLAGQQQQAMQEFSMANERLKKTKDSRPTRPAEQANRELIINKLTADSLLYGTLLEQISYVLDFSESTGGGVKIHFRVYYDADGTQVNLLVTDEGSAAESKK